MTYQIIVVTWVCVAIFVATALITIGGLLKIINLPDFYLRRLFFTLIVETAVISVSAFAATLMTSENLTDATSSNIKRMQENMEAMESRLKKIEGKLNLTPAQTAKKWELVRIDDCTGKDLPSPTSGAEPSVAQCTSPNLTAVCWDGILFTNGRTAWCTYKTVNPAECSGGTSPGQLYRCTP